MKSLTEGNPLKLILLFSIPLFIGRILQLLYAIVDTRIVGVYLGEAALAAVGGTSTISDLLTEFMIGVTGGFAIITANLFGAKNHELLRRSVGSAFGMTAAVSIGITLVSLIFLDPILNALNVPSDIYSDARSYIMIIICGLIFGALYNICASVLRSIGDSMTPLMFLILSSIINIALDYTLISLFKMGTAGAAIATVVSQAVSFILCLSYMWKKYPLLRFEAKDITAMGEYSSKMLKAGTSMGFMSAFVSLGTVSLQGAINMLGTDIIVAHTAARKVSMMFMLPFGAFGQTLATYCGQNMGAGKYDRIRTGFWRTLFLTWIWCIAVIVCANIFSKDLITLITASANPVILESAGMYLSFDTAFYFIPSLIALSRNSIQGVGDTFTPVISSFIEFAGKLLIALFLAPVIGYWGIIVAEPIVWILMVIPLIAALMKNKAFRVQK